MEINRRQFLSRTAATLGGVAYAGGHSPRETLAAAARTATTLRITMGGLMTPVLKRRGASGIPATVPRLDVLFMHAEIPHTFAIDIDGGTRTVKDCIVEIEPEGSPLAGDVRVVQNARRRDGGGNPLGRCPASDAEWSDLSWLMDPGRASGKPSQIDPANIDRPPDPARVVGRISLRGGTVRCLKPRGYTGELWSFERATGEKYEQAMAEVIEFTTTIDATRVHLRFTPFGSEPAPKPAAIDAVNGQITIHMFNRVADPAHADSPHFNAYYAALQDPPQHQPKVARVRDPNCPAGGFQPFGDPYFCVAGIVFDQR